MEQSLLVSVAALEPGAPLDAAVSLADALDARRVPVTLLVGPRPHPEVVAWVGARRRAGDAALLFGTRPGEHVHAHRRLPAHEAGLHLTAALRSRDVLGLPVDGFAAPGWTVSDGARRALARAGVDVVVDDDGVHRLDPTGALACSRVGALSVVGREPARERPWSRRFLRARRRPAASLRHLTLSAGGDAGALLDAVDVALDAGAVPATPALLLPASPTPRRSAGPDPELWSITA